MEKHLKKAWSRYKPTITHLRVFGSIAYTHVPDQKRTKLDDKSARYVFIGYDQSSKGYKLYNPSSRKIVISRDVEFDEEGVWKWNDQNKNDRYSPFFDDEKEDMSQPITPPSTSPPQNIQVDEASSSEGPRGFRGLRELYDVTEKNTTTFQVGVVLDLESLVGRISLTSLSLALSDFYSLHTNYSTRTVLHTRDSKGLVTDAAASTLNLLNEVEADAIIGPQESAQANFVIGLGDTAKVPIISFSATSPSLHPRTPYFVQTAPTDAAQVDAIAAIVKYFRWGQVVLVYEDSEYGNGIVPFLSNAFQDVNARVSYRSIIPVSATDDFILQELYKMKTMQTRVFVVHISSSLASRFFLKVKEAEMMSEGMHGLYPVS
ncbi:Glutamate receptor 2.5 [Sesamum alatum]|uniref:Glutamate receptor 2.5 n=1 Tax=Sesamum alatum TaxID=300844 RepID=A0AAE1YGH1_9LAMI|nr:Glutamate receptor 2.5 [Sesamum alatum]